MMHAGHQEGEGRLINHCPPRVAMFGVRRGEATRAQSGSSLLDLEVSKKDLPRPLSNNPAILAINPRQSQRQLIVTNCAIIL